MITTMKRVVVLGGGTGTFTVLSGLKKHPIELAAVVSIADNGGSTGVLRDELGVLPPGDIRQCLVALSEGDDILRRLFTYRFHEGSLSGHTFGNLFLSALEKITGNSLAAVAEAQRILNVRGRVIPVSAYASNLYAELTDGTVIEGQHEIDEAAGERAAIRRCFLSPSVQANPEAISAIQEADLLVMGPGDLFTSLIPVLLVDGIASAIARASAKVVYIMNLVTKHGQTDGYTATRYLETVEAAMQGRSIDYCLLNTQQPPVDIQNRYEEAGETVVKDDVSRPQTMVLRQPLLSEGTTVPIKGDVIRRSLLRHDPERVADVLASLLDRSS